MFRVITMSSTVDVTSKNYCSVKVTNLYNFDIISRAFYSLNATVTDLMKTQHCFEYINIMFCKYLKKC